MKSWEAKTFASDNISISFKTDSQKRSKGFLIGYKSVILTTTTTKPTTASPTWSPDYFDWLYQDLYKTYPDYYYFDAWNEPLIPNIPWIEPKPAVTTTTTMAPAATIQTSKSILFLLLASYCRVRARVIAINTTFNNLSAISWWSVLLVEETGVHGENNRPAASH